jgi:hypothetical protein
MDTNQVHNWSGPFSSTSWLRFRCDICGTLAVSDKEKIEKASKICTPQIRTTTNDPSQTAINTRCQDAFIGKL